MTQTALERLKERFPDAVTEAYTDPGGDDVALVKRESVEEICRLLKRTPGWPSTWARPDRGGLHGPEPRFEVVYHLYSVTKNHRLRLKVGVAEAEPVVRTVTPLWTGANWLEREVWDMYGIRFEGHPDLRRICCTRSSSATRCARTTPGRSASPSSRNGRSTSPAAAPAPPAARR